MSSRYVASCSLWKRCGSPSPALLIKRVKKSQTEPFLTHELLVLLAQVACGDPQLRPAGRATLNNPFDDSNRGNPAPSPTVAMRDQHRNKDLLNPWHVQILLVSAGLCVTSSSQQIEIKPWRCVIASESVLNLSSNQEQLRHKEQSLTLAVQVFSSKLTFHNRVLVTSTLTYSWEQSWNPTEQDSIPYNSAMPAPQDS